MKICLQYTLLIEKLLFVTASLDKGNQISTEHLPLDKKCDKISA